MARLPNFTANLLHRKAYGYDVGGEVHDDTQLNVIDTVKNRNQQGESVAPDPYDPAATEEEES
jgi:hypothetical protein